MKKLSVLLCTALSLAACGNQTNKSNSQNDTIPVTCIEKEDTSNTHMVAISIEWPTAEGALADSLREYIGTCLDECTSFEYDDNGNLIYRPYKGDRTDGEKMVEYTVNSAKKDLINSTKESREFIEDVPPSSLGAEIFISDKNDEFVNITTQKETYLGGAHGSYQIYISSFDRETGERIKYEIDESKLSDMQPLLRKYIKEYFAENGETKMSDDELDSYLALEDPTNIPLPSQGLFLEEDGVGFLYQQYEIACYAAGLISFTIPYEEIEKFKK
ncbi:MAG: RsiV family protein [Bacteroidaceae bacterium]|nr:RsiV family protein [Bacteroidaceae bacterium]